LHVEQTPVQSHLVHPGVKHGLHPATPVLTQNKPNPG